MKTNLAKLLKRHTSGWISISGDYKEVIASGNSLENLMTKLRKMGNPNGILMKASKDYSRYSGYAAE